MKIPAFTNLGNTCYINSVLQSFIYNEQLKQLLKESDVPFITELNKVLEIVDTSKNGEHLAVLYNLANLITYFPFKRFEQQDAHECIMYFLDLINLNSQIKKLYYGETKTNIHCLKCKNLKSIYEEFNTINLNIPLEKSNLTNLLVKYFEKEVINKENLYFCEPCKSLTNYEKKIILNVLPQTLIIVLKRYTFTGSKIISEVEIDSILKIKESSTGNIKMYTLQSIINHSGDLYNGHYTNFVFNGLWLYIDDEKIQMRQVDSKDAYILFYTS